MNAQLPGYTLSFVQSMLTEQAGRASGWFKDLQLSTVFQPAFSLTYKKAVGFEANLRGAGEDGSIVGPRTMFGPVENFAETCLLDLLGATVHVHNFASSQPTSGLLFLNLHPEVFLEFGHSAAFLSSLFEHYRIAGRRVVLDIPAAALKLEGVDAAIAAYRELNCLLSIDDVGIEPADLDHVMHIRPDIVKIDHSVTTAAVASEPLRDRLLHAISVLHEMGALVMLEGLESEAEALVALETDADFATGFFFGPLLDDVGAFEEPKRIMDKLWSRYKQKRRPSQAPATAAQSRSSLDQDGLNFSTHIKKLRAASAAEINRYRDERRPFVGAIRQAGARVQTGAGVRASTDEFLKLEGAIRCYLLGSDGAQIGMDVSGALAPAPQDTNYLELVKGGVAEWSRRDYFRRAISDPEVVQVSRQYYSLSGYRQCVTFAIATTANGATVVLCGDVDWSRHTPSL